MTPNEKKVLEIITYENVSLRDILKRTNLAGLTSVAYVVNSLERKGYLIKEGENTNKTYKSTGKHDFFIQHYDKKLNKIASPEWQMMCNGTTK